MNLNDRKKYFEYAYEAHISGEKTFPPYKSDKLLLSKDDGITVMDLDQKFSLMFWRLLSDGSVVSCIEFERPSITPSPLSASKFGTHRHNYIELSYVSRGSFGQKINGVDYIFREGDVWIMDRNCVHSENIAGHDGFIVFFDIYAEFFDELLSSFDDTPLQQFFKTALLNQRKINRFIHFTPRENSENLIEPMIAFAVDEKEKNLPGTTHLLKGTFINLFYILTKSYDFMMTDKETQSLQVLMFDEISNYMRENSATVNLKVLSERFNYNLNYFNRLIHSMTGKTYLEYLQDIRLLKAETLLVNTNRSIDGIIEEVGYRNKSYFYRVFKERFDVTPLQYRKQKQVTMEK